mmetsp:Transcript_27826/g.74965  ORF Transcript_27826/g.74965 Transcript_27826/m.74965 type:complete len:565 (-) Transcript_27826:489-2183(-)
MAQDLVASLETLVARCEVDAGKLSENALRAAVAASDRLSRILARAAETAGTRLDPEGPPAPTRVRAMVQGEASLAVLPERVLERVLSFIEAPEDFARLSSVARVFRGEPRALSLVERALLARTPPNDQGFTAHAALAHHERLNLQHLLRREAIYRGRSRTSPIASGPIVNHTFAYSAIVDAAGVMRVTGSSWDSKSQGVPVLFGETELPTPRPVPLPCGQRVVLVSAGNDHLLFVTASGGVWSMGRGSTGALGHGDVEDKSQPAQIDYLRDLYAVDASAAQEHSLVVTACGRLYSFGRAGSGQLGHGDLETRRQPVRVTGMRGAHIIGCSAGGLHSLALGLDGCVWSFGWGAHGQLGHGDGTGKARPARIDSLAKEARIVQVSAGSRYSLALSADGRVFSFGAGKRGALGHGDSADVYTPKAIRGVLERRRVVCVTASHSASLVVTDDGQLYAFGTSEFGAHGLPSGVPKTARPTKVEALPATAHAVGVSTGRYHSLVVTQDGRVHAFGRGTGTTGQGQNAAQVRGTLDGVGRVKVVIAPSTPRAAHRPPAQARSRSAQPQTSS